ncbi:MAG TPA: hypothetical protein PK173_12295 [Dokdonella sp.]|jgi:hypothetical protein|uniref:hypothetical protein n=1 Tax=Dokdonella sp. TaxID=2291710 RepID=UPI002BB826C8|nr:hypothetical protein [Dokdonella sp.]HPW04985.1 hypothetical protein [Dokdonella sp.]
MSSVFVQSFPNGVASSPSTGFTRLKGLCAPELRRFLVPRRGYFFENAFRAKSLVSLPFCRSRAISEFVSRSETDEVLGCFCGECGRVEVEL